jgi:hypothetical protein
LVWAAARDEHGLLKVLLKVQQRHIVAFTQHSPAGQRAEAAGAAAAAALAAAIRVTHRLKQHRKHCCEVTLRGSTQLRDSLLKALLKVQQRRTMALAQRNIAACVKLLSVYSLPTCASPPA